MLRKILAGMLSAMIIGGCINNTNIIVILDKQQSIEVAYELETGDVEPEMVIEINQKG